MTRKLDGLGLHGTVTTFSGDWESLQHDHPNLSDTLSGDLQGDSSSRIGKPIPQTWTWGLELSRISLILQPPFPMREPHWLAGTTSLRVTGGLLAAVLLVIELLMSYKKKKLGYQRDIQAKADPQEPMASIKNHNCVQVTSLNWQRFKYQISN